MTTSKLKIKVGDHEFEAEGTQESVQEQLEVFKHLIGLGKTPVGRQSPSLATSNELAESDQNQKPPSKGEVSSTESGLRDSLAKICGQSGPTISLTALPESEEEAGLIILLSQQVLNEIEGVTGSRLLKGMKQSGYKTDRADRLFVDAMESGLVIRSGKHRGTRYRLTNQGYSKASKLVANVRSRLP